MLSKKECIEKSRNFVCIRIDPYEKEEHAQWVRDLWRGVLTNSIFAMLEPDGETHLSRGGRGPTMVFGDNETFFEKMDEVAKKFRPREDVTQAVVPDFHTFRQALNTASCDQRPLVAVAMKTESDKEALEKRLRQVAWHQGVTGCFHWDFVVSDSEDWQEVVSGGTADTGIFVIKPDRFGLKGSVMTKFSGTEPPAKIVSDLRDAFFDFQKKMEPKPYSEHRREGMRKGIDFPQELEQAEER